MFKIKRRRRKSRAPKKVDVTLDGMTYLLCLLLALPLSQHKAPAVFRVKFETTAGTFLIEAHREWSPNGADRFYELVRTKYYDDSRFLPCRPRPLGTVRYQR